LAEFTKTASRTFLTAAIESDITRQFALFCAACLFVFLISLTYGLDLSPGFF